MSDDYVIENQLGLAFTSDGLATLRLNDEEVTAPAALMAAMLTMILGELSDHAGLTDAEVKEALQQLVQQKQFLYEQKQGGHA